MMKTVGAQPNSLPWRNPSGSGMLCAQSLCGKWGGKFETGLLAKLSCLFTNGA